MRHVPALCFAALLATCAGYAQPVIDVHTHADFGKHTREELLIEWREAGVVGAVFHTGRDGSGKRADWPSGTAVQCLGIGERVDLKAIEAGLRTNYFKCVKIYLGYVYRFAYDPIYVPVYRLAAKYKAPVVFHTGDTITAEGKVKYSHPLTIDEVAVDHRSTNFVIAHCGNPWIQSAAEVAYKNPNVYIECSALLLGDMNTMPKEKVDEYVVKPISWLFGYLEDPRKLMFGSDWPASKIKPYLDAYKRAIPQEHWRAVLHDNAARLFGLDTNRR